MAGNQLFLFRISRPRMTTLGHSSIGNGTALLGMMRLPVATDPVSRPISGTSALCFGWLLRIRQVNRALVEQALGELLDQHRIDHGRRDRRVAEHVLLDARRVDHVAEEIEQRLAIGENRTASSCGPGPR